MRLHISAWLGILGLVLVLLAVAPAPPVQASGTEREVTLRNGDRVTVRQSGSETLFVLPSGERVVRTEMGHGSAAWSAGPNVWQYELDQAEEAWRIYQGLRPPRRERDVPLFVALLVIVAGLFNLLAPQAAWYLSEGWKFKDAEPSDLALFMGRVLGGGLCLLGLFLLLAG